MEVIFIVYSIVVNEKKREGRGRWRREREEEWQRVGRGERME